MTTFARGVSKLVAINYENNGFGVLGSGAGQYLRRTQSDLSPTIQFVQSQEILPSQQVRDSRAGARQVGGTIAGQLSPTTYTELLQGVLRNTYAQVTSIGPLSDTSSTIDGNGALVVTSASANWTANFHIGDMIRMTGLTGAAGTALNQADMRVVAVSSTVVSLSPPAAVTSVAWSGSSQAAVTFALPGKRLIIPATGQLDRSYSIEHQYSDIGQNELFLGCKITQVSLQIAPNGFVQFQASVLGQNMTTSTGTASLASAAAPTSTIGLTSTAGRVLYQGVPVLYITGASIQIAASVSNDPVIGSNIAPAIFPGTVMVQGSFTALSAADTMTSDFLSEVETSLSFLLTTGQTSNSDFVSIHLPRVKLTGQSKNDSDKAITRSFNFMALENAGTVVGADLSSILIQDSLTS